jgi:hypothetical protein
VALFGDAAEVKTTDVYRARPFELCQVAEARDCILRRLAEIEARENCAGGRLGRAR